MRLSPADLRGLVVFRAIVDHGGFAGALLALGMSQSTISFHLKALEDRLGFKLCRRGRGGFTLTERGREVYERSSGLMAAVSSFETSLGELRHRIVGTLRVGFVDNTITNPDLPLDTIIQSFLEAAPEAAIQLTIANPEILIAEIINGGIDIAVTPEIEIGGGLQKAHFYNEAHSLHCGDRHHLFSLEREPRPSEVEECSFVARPYAKKRELHHFPHANIHAYASNMEAQAALILSGCYIGYLPDHFAARWISLGRMRTLVPSARITSPFVLLSKADPNPPPLTRLFVSMSTAHTSGSQCSSRNAA